MGYRNLRQCVDDLQRRGNLVRIDSPVNADLEAAAIHRRVHAAGGPAILMTNVTGCRFPMVSNLFGTFERIPSPGGAQNRSGESAAPSPELSVFGPYRSDDAPQVCSARRRAVGTHDN